MSLFFPSYGLKMDSLNQGNDMMTKFNNFFREQQSSVCTVKILFHKIECFSVRKWLKQSNLVLMLPASYRYQVKNNVFFFIFSYGLSFRRCCSDSYWRRSCAWSSHLDAGYQKKCQQQPYLPLQQIDTYHIRYKKNKSDFKKSGIATDHGPSYQGYLILNPIPVGWVSN